MPSTAINAFDYDAAARRLEVEFITGRRYAYHDVPEEIAQGLRSARSKGGYFNRKIRDRFSFTPCREQSEA